MSRQSGPNKSEDEPRFTRPLTVENAMEWLLEGMLDEAPEPDSNGSSSLEGADVIDLKPPQDPDEPDSQNPQT